MEFETGDLVKRKTRNYDNKMEIVIVISRNRTCFTMELINTNKLVYRIATNFEKIITNDK